MHSNELRTYLDQSWSQFAPDQPIPQHITPLHGGLTNTSFIVQNNSTRWVLRIDNPLGATLGIDREREHQILRIVSAAGLAPAILFRDNVAGVLVSEYIDGEVSSQVEDPLRRERWLEQVRQLHQLTVELPVFNYTACLNQLRSEEDEPLSEIEREALASIDAIAETVLCHHDLNPLNAIYVDKQFRMIDFEYAARGKAVMDCAALVCEWHFELNEIAEHFECERDVLKQACEAYRAMGHYWLKRRQHALGI